MITTKLAEKFKIRYEFELSSNLMSYHDFVNVWFLLESNIRFFDAVNDMNELNNFDYFRNAKLQQFIQTMENLRLIDNSTKLSYHNMLSSWSREDWYMAFQLIFCRINQELSDV